MDNEDIILVAKLADASLELAAKYETGDENETEQAATARQQTCRNSLISADLHNCSNSKTRFSLATKRLLPSA